MEDDLFDEQHADREIIGSLLNANNVLWRELEDERTRVRSLREQLNRRTESMSKILQDLEGKLYIAHEVEELTVDAAHELVSLFEEDLSQVKAFLERAAGVSAPAAPTTAAPSDAPAQPDQPGQPVSQPAAPDAPTDQPSVEPAPVDAPAAPEAPADPSAQPAAPEVPAAPVDQPAPADPNAAQPAADPNAAPADPNAVPPLQ